MHNYGSFTCKTLKQQKIINWNLLKSFFGQVAKKDDYENSHSDIEVGFAILKWQMMNDIFHCPESPGNLLHSREREEQRGSWDLMLPPPDIGCQTFSLDHGQPLLSA